MAPQPPKACFGKSWDGNNVLCRGGLDPTYIHPKNGGNQREQCAWFNPCATRVNAASMTQQQVIPREQLLRRPQPQQQQMAQPTSPWAPVRQMANNVMQRLVQPPQTQVPTYPPPQVLVHPQQQQQQQQMYYPPQQQQQMMPQPMVQPMMAMMPQAAPMNYQWPSSQMPGYLTIPEPIVSGQHWGVRLFYNVMRSMAKAGMHTGSNFFDHTPFNAFPQPMQQAQPVQQMQPGVASNG